jgi:hypothetical protein
LSSVLARISHRFLPLSSGATPVVIATPDVSLSYAILNRHLFMNRQDLGLPMCLLPMAAAIS